MIALVASTEQQFSFADCQIVSKTPAKSDQSVERSERSFVHSERATRS